MPRGRDPRRRSRSRSTSWSSSASDRRHKSRKRRHVSGSRSGSRSSRSSVHSVAAVNVPECVPSQAVLLARATAGLKPKAQSTQNSQPVSDQDLISAARNVENSLVGSALGDGNSGVLHDDESDHGDQNGGDGFGEDHTSGDLLPEENQVNDELLDDDEAVAELIRHDDDTKILADTPEEAIQRANAQRGTLVTPTVKAWAKKHQHSTRMTGIVRRAFRAKFGRTGHILIDTPPRRDDDFSDKGAWGLNKAKDKVGLIAVQPAAFKMLSDKLFRLHDSIVEASRISYQLGDLVESLRNLPPSDDLPHMKDEALTHTVNACNWAATFNADVTHQLTAIRRFANVIPFCRNKNAAQLRSIYADLDAEGINLRSKKELGTFPTPDVAPPLLYGRSLKRRLHDKFKDRRRTENVIGDLLGNDNRPRRDNRAPSRVQSLPAYNSRPQFQRNFVQSRGNFRQFNANRINTQLKAVGVKDTFYSVDSVEKPKNKFFANPFDSEFFEKFDAPEHPVVSGRIRFAYVNWAKISSDPWILRIVEGAKLGLSRQPVQDKPLQPIAFDDEHSKIISDKVVEMLQKGAISEVPFSEAGFVCRIFTVVQRSGKIRPILNLSPLNKFIVAPNFKMETIHSLRSILRPSDFMGKIDLSDAYFTIPIVPEERKYLQFIWESKLWQFSCLPFGLSTAPFIFTKLMASVVAFWRARGIRCLIYLDDMLIMCNDKDKLSEQLEFCIFTLLSLGFFVNRQKCELTPSNSVEYLGLLVNSLTMTFHVPLLKQDEIMERAGRLLLAQTFAEFTGMSCSSTTADGD